MAAASKESSPAERHQFEAEVGQLLDLMVNALYSQRDVFLRELVSNAADAADRLRYAALSKPELLGDNPDPKILLTVDPESRVLEIEDNGIGMSKAALAKDLGTIARSGTRTFVERMAKSADGKQKPDLSLIGQFGVGFYSAFMVAEHVEVESVAAGTAKGWVWSSDGRGSYEIARTGRTRRGTCVRLHLKEDAKEYLEEARLRHVVRTWSDHVSVPIELRVSRDQQPQVINTAAALWTRPKKDITPEQYVSFYRDVGHSFDEPWITLHNRAEGKLSYITLLFIPTEQPLDLYDPERRRQLRLFVKRVFITDRTDALIPPWLRFVRGVVDSEDLSLNVSREMLQQDPHVARLRRSITRRVLDALKKKAEKEPDAYARFWRIFGPVLKEGVYDDDEWRDKLLELLRFRSAGGQATDELVSLSGYVGRMKEGQSEIYYISGDDPAQLAESPQIEGFRARGLEVLLLSDAVDDFWVPRVSEYQGKSLRSVTKGGIDLSGFEPEQQDGAPDEAPAGDVDRLITRFKTVLGDEVADVVRSDQLTESPAVLVAHKDGMDLQVEKLLQRHGQLQELSRKVLEINPANELIRALGRDDVNDQEFADAAHVLLDHARLVAGESVSDLAQFGRRTNRLIGRGLG